MCVRVCACGCVCVCVCVVSPIGDSPFWEVVTERSPMGDEKQLGDAHTLNPKP